MTEHWTSPFDDLSHDKFAREQVATSRFLDLNFDSERSGDNLCVLEQFRGLSVSALCECEVIE